MALSIPNDDGQFLKLPNLTTAERDALPSVNGHVVFNSSTESFNTRIASTWKAINAPYSVDGTYSSSLAGTTSVVLNEALDKKGYRVGIAYIQGSIVVAGTGNSGRIGAITNIKTAQNSGHNASYQEYGTYGGLFNTQVTSARLTDTLLGTSASVYLRAVYLSADGDSVNMDFYNDTAISATLTLSYSLLVW